MFPESLSYAKDALESVYVFMKLKKEVKSFLKKKTTRLLKVGGGCLVIGGFFGWWGTAEYKEFIFTKKLKEQEVGFKKIRIAYTRAEKKLKDQIDQMEKKRKIASTTECPNLSEVKLYIKK